MFVVQVVPGETALAFYRAKNPTDKPIVGISTYNVVPFEAGQYFNKIQVSLPAAGSSSPHHNKSTRPVPGHEAPLVYVKHVLLRPLRSVSASRSSV